MPSLPVAVELARVNTANLEFYNPSGGITISNILFHPTATNVTFLTASSGVVPSFTGLDMVRTGNISWAEFGRCYRDELFEGGTIDRRNRTIRNHGQKFTLRLLKELGKCQTVTLMCHCAEAERHCHRHILQQVLQGTL